MPAKAGIPFSFFVIPQNALLQLQMRGYPESDLFSFFSVIPAKAGIQIENFCFLFLLFPIYHIDSLIIVIFFVS